MEKVLEALVRLADDDLRRAGLLEIEGDEETRDEQVTLETIAEQVEALAKQLEGAVYTLSAADAIERLVADFMYHALLTPRDDKGTKQAYNNAVSVLGQQAARVRKLASS